LFILLLRQCSSFFCPDDQPNKNLISFGFVSLNWLNEVSHCITGQVTKSKPVHFLQTVCTLLGSWLIIPDWNWNIKMSRVYLIFLSFAMHNSPIYRFAQQFYEHHNTTSVHSGGTKEAHQTCTWSPSPCSLQTQYAFGRISPLVMCLSCLSLKQVSPAVFLVQDIPISLQALLVWMMCI
jgi:hypothetical protein